MIAVQIAVGLYVLMTAVFIISENRNPQSTFAWMFLFIVLPPVGLLIYFLVGREYKAFSRRRKLNAQDAPRQLFDVHRSLAQEHKNAIDLFDDKSERNVQLATLVHSNTNASVTLCNRIRVLQDASVAYPALIEALEKARSSIHLHFYSWASDALGMELKDILAAKVRDGVEVRILYDPVGSMLMLKGSYIRAMRAAGINMRPFSALWRIHTISYRNHRKIAVVDGEIALTGGMNIGCEHITPPEGFATWRDTMVRIEGSAARSLQGVFAIDWLNATGEPLESESYFPPMKRENWAGTHLPTQLCLSGPDSDWRAIRQLYFAMITAARSQILITSPFFILDDSISAALRSAALSGVDVRVMISARGPGQYIPYWAASTYAAEVAKAGAKVLLYEKGYLHAKTLCVDGEVCAIGSANMDIRSFSINYEQTAVIYDPAITGELQAQFLADEADCAAFDLAAYKKSPRLLRFRDSLSRLASPLL